ncbi:MAG: TetR/AcrR family transcriptional regulator [Actinobacteria bacterium]|nr:TetR/AcrR family transcriptional regulator [Actinomycetota bacterium]
MKQTPTTSPAASGEERTPVTERGRKTREGVVAAAREVFEELGFNDATMSDVAARAGVSHGTVYVYFDSKAALLAQVVAELLAEVGDYLRVVDGEDPAARIAEANLRYLQVYTRHARLLQVVEQVATSDASFAAVLAEFRARHVSRVADGIGRLQAHGLIAQDVDADIAAAALSAMVEGYARHSPGYDAEAVYPTLTKLWLRALGLNSSASVSTAQHNSNAPANRRSDRGAPREDHVDALQ